MRPVRFARYVALSGWLQRAAYMPPLQGNKSLPLGGKVARYAPDEGEMSGSYPLISHLR